MRWRQEYSVWGVAPAPRGTAVTALFIPFPLSRRRELVRTLAAKMAKAATSDDAERFFQGRAARLARGLRRKRVTEAIIERELRALEGAVRAELWSLLFAPCS